MDTEKTPISGTPSGHFGVAANVKHSLLREDIRRYCVISSGVVVTACAAFGIALGLTYLLGAMGVANYGKSSSSQQTHNGKVFYNNALFVTRVNPDSTLDVETSYTVNIDERGKFRFISQLLDHLNFAEKPLSYAPIRGFYKHDIREQELGSGDGTLKIVKRPDGTPSALVSEPGGFLEAGPQLFRSILRVSGAINTVKEEGQEYAVLSYNLNNLSKVSTGPVKVKHFPKQIANLDHPALEYKATLEKHVIAQGVGEDGAPSGAAFVLAERWQGQLIRNTLTGGGVEYVVEFPEIPGLGPRESLILKERYKELVQQQ